MNSQKKLRKDIQVLRGFAVLAVLFYHAFPNVFPNGLLGVDIFFVISGYVIAPKIIELLEDRESGLVRNVGKFYKSRFLRLAPALSAMFIVTLPLVLFMGPLNDHRRSFLQAVFALFGIANIGAYWFAGNYFEPNPNPYIHTWSLSVEEQVYLVLPWLIGFYYIRFKRAPHRILIVLSLASGSLFLFPSLMSTMYRMLGFESINTISFYSTLNRFWEFGLGAIISISPRQKWLQSLKKIRIPFVLLLIAMVFGSFTIEPRAQVVAIALLTAVVIDSNLELKTRAIALLEKIGDASYSIYLLHMPLLYLLRYSPLFVSQPAWRLEALAFLGLLTSVVVGFIFHAKIEEKYRLKRSEEYPRIKKRIRRQTGGLLFLAVITTIGITLLPYSNYLGNIDKNERNKLSRISIDCTTALCLINKSATSKTLLLVGDSHAGQYAPILKNFGRFNNFNVYYGNDTFLNSKSYLAWLKVKKPIVVYSRYWHGSPFEFRNWKTLSDIGLEVLVLGNNPVYPDETLFMNNDSLLTRAYIPKKWYPRRSLLEITSRADVLVKQMSVKYGFVYVETSDIFCKLNRCTRFQNEEWLYADDDHLSYAGTKLVLPAFKEIILSAPTDK